MKEEKVLEIALDTRYFSQILDDRHNLELGDLNNETIKIIS